jgi:tetratricopeptide (TPR) repeat protein
MNSHSLTRLICSTGNSIYYSAAKGILIIFVLTGIFKAQTAVAVDFKTYLQGARSEITHHKESIREDPLDAIAYFELGRSYLALGKHEAEVKAYREAIQLYPNYIGAHYNLAMAYDLLKDGPKSIKHMLSALNLYYAKRNHARIRNVQRQLKRLYLKYPSKTIAQEKLD